MELWDYAVKVADLDAAAAFHSDILGGDLRLAGQMFGCDYRVLRPGGVCREITQIITHTGIA